VNGVDIVAYIRRLVAFATAPSERTILEHAAMAAADEIERLRAAGDALAEALDWPEFTASWQEARRER
jgi:hypothetical protein